MEKPQMYCELFPEQIGAQGSDKRLRHSTARHGMARKGKHRIASQRIARFASTRQASKQQAASSAVSAAMTLCEHATDWTWRWCWALLAITGARALDCCPGSSLSAAYHGDCADGQPPALQCSAFLLRPDVNPELDSYYVREDGVLVVGQGAHQFHADGDSFCEASVAGSNASAALVCVPSGADRSDVLYRVYGVCLWLSAAFLALTSLVYGTLAPLRDVDGGCLVAYMMSLCLGCVGLAWVQLSGDVPPPYCVTLAFFTYFWLLSAFFWLNVVALNTWKSVCVTRRRVFLTDGRLFAVYCAYAWTPPLAFLAAALVSHHGADDEDTLKPNFGRSSCWFGGPIETWAFFYGPVACLLAANVVLFLWAAVVLWRHTDAREVRSLRFRTALYAKLFLLMGVSWVFEVLSFAVGGSAYAWLVTDLLNALQGLLVFLLLVVFRKRVLRLLAEKIPLLQKCVRRDGDTDRDMDADEEGAESSEAEGEELASTCACPEEPVKTSIC